MTTTLASQLPRINLAIDRSMQSAQVVTLKSGQQNASSVDSKSPMHSFELRTSSTLPRCSRAIQKLRFLDQGVSSGCRQPRSYREEARIEMPCEITFGGSPLYNPALFGIVLGTG